MVVISLSFLNLTLVHGIWQLIGEIKVDEPGFLNIYQHRNATVLDERYSLLLSSFLPIPDTDDRLFMYPFIGKYLSNVTLAERRILSTGLVWPREPSQIPSKTLFEL